MSERLIQSVDRAVDILELFLESTPELSVKEISDRLQLPKSTIHGLIKTLEHRGFIEQNPQDSKYRLGMKLFELGNRVGSNLEVGKVGRPIIGGLMEELKETIHLVERHGDEVIYIEKVEGPSALRIYSHIGKRAPLHCTGVGKAILAFQEESEIDRLLSINPLESFTPYTLTDREKIKASFAKIREEGFAVDDEEIELGLKCIAAPIFNHQGRVMASVSCSSPKLRLTQERQSDVIRGVKNAALEISRKLGYSG